MPSEGPRVTNKERVSLEATGDATLGEVVGSHFDQHLVAGKHADA
jgi:hypothetical protein